MKDTELNGPERRVACGKCGGEVFKASILQGTEAVVISFTCQKCGHIHRAGVKRNIVLQQQKNEEEKKGFFETLKESLSFGKKKDEVDWERDLAALLDESAS
ncbi:MAG: hypothetical protein QXH27_01255 [Candidatus Micrarchaeia archaeon]